MNPSSLAPVVHDVRLDGEGHWLRGRPLQAVHGVRLAVQPWAAIQYTFKCLKIDKLLVDVNNYATIRDVFKHIE